MFFAPFLILYAIIFFLILAFLFVLLEIGVIKHAFLMVGLPPEMAFLALFASLIGSYINIPLTKIASGRPYPQEIVDSFGMRYRLPMRYAGATTTLAINVGGALVPVLISLYALLKQPAAILPAAIGVAIVALVVNRCARPVPGLGIATPMFIPPVVAALVAVGLTDVEPEVGLKVPVTPEMVTVVAPCTAQLKMDDPPGAMVEGVATNDRTVTGVAAMIFTSVVALADRLSVLVTVNLKT